MHGETQLYVSNYSDEELDRLAQEIKEDDQVKEVYIYFNNDTHAYAIDNAKYLQKKLET